MFTYAFIPSDIPPNLHALYLPVLNSISSEMFISFRNLHSSKAPSTILFTPSLINTFSNDEHTENAPSPISVTPPGIMISFKDLQLENVYLPIVVTPSGMMTSFSDSQP